MKLRLLVIVILFLCVSLPGFSKEPEGPITKERIRAGPLASKIDPPLSPPIPLSQWSRETKLWLARSCAGEAGFASYDECIGIAWVYATRVKETGAGLLYTIRRYSSAVKNWETKPRKWLLHLDLQGNKPKYWPKNLKWGNHKYLWLRNLKVLDDWAKGHYANPVEGANHYGGSMDKPGARWVEIHPQPRWLYRNRFYRSAKI